MRDIRDAPFDGKVRMSAFVDNAKRVPQGQRLFEEVRELMKGRGYRQFSTSLFNQALHSENLRLVGLRDDRRPDMFQS